MKTTVQLDYPAILANSAQPVHLAFEFTAPTTTPKRSAPIAFCLVLDRSGSMEGRPLAAAKEAAKAVVHNLRREDLFALVIFDGRSEVLFPLAPVIDREALCKRIDAITANSATNLAAGWMLGRDQLRCAPEGTLRRQLLLTDGLVNAGIIDPIRVKQVVVDGLERDNIRTTTLGLGDQYQEDLLSDLAEATGGAFYDANDAEGLPAIFRAELDGLQNVAVQNLRVRLRPLDFVEDVRSLGGYHPLKLADGRSEYALGDLVSEESRVAVFALSVMPIPLNAGSLTPAADLHGEELIEAEIVYDEITRDTVTSHTELHRIRVVPTQSPEDVKVNRAVLAWVSAQQAADLLNRAIEKRDQGDTRGARLLLEDGIRRLKAYASDAEIADALLLLQNALPGIDLDIEFSRSRKEMRSSSSYYRSMSSHRHWSSKNPPPSFSKSPPASPPPEDEGNPPKPPQLP